MIGGRSKSGSVLVLVLLIVLILLGLGAVVSTMIKTNIKGIYYQKLEFKQFQNADGGIYAVAGWMYFYKRTDVPIEVTETSNYRVYYKVLSDTIRNVPGYSGQWQGFDVRLTSTSGPTTIESVVFVPVSLVGYGNE